MENLWKRIAEGRSAAVVGGRVPDPPAGWSAHLVRVRCDRPPSVLGPLLEARAKIERLIETQSTSTIVDLDRYRRADRTLRRRLLDEVPERGGTAGFIESLNRLADRSDRPSALVLDALEDADESTLQWLVQAIERPGWLRLPLVLGYRSTNPNGAAREVLDRLREREGPDCIAAIDQPVLENDAVALSRPKLEDLPPRVLMTLRAGALVGSGFEAELVARLLRQPELTVLERLQGARDAGVAIDDHGEGRFHLPPALVQSLRASTLPSLAAAWHRRLASLLSGEAEGSAANGRTAHLDEREQEHEADAAAARAHELPLRVVANAHGAGRERARASQTVAAPPPARAPKEQPAAARAAGHLASAGDHEAAARRYLDAAREAASMGAFHQADVHCQQALRLSEAFPLTRPWRLLRIDALAEMGRVRWEAGGPDGAFTLDDALEPLDAARALVSEVDASEALPPQSAARVLELVAGVCYDRGDPASLERALAELVEASRLLQAAGDSVGATRLLNDQAAVWVRLGDYPRANHLLGESRKVFASAAGHDAVALAELAETDHLLARLVLHAPARPGRHEDAIALGIQHAKAAEQAYAGLEHAREQARVWETLGRLELEAGRPEVAADWLSHAVQVQRRIADVIGLARSAQGLAEVLAVTGNPRAALEVLAESVALNLEKGSPLGLAFNRRTLAALAERVPGGADGPHGELLAQVIERLSHAERTLGVVPPAPDGVGE